MLAGLRMRTQTCAAAAAAVAAQFVSPFATVSAHKKFECAIIKTTLFIVYRIQSFFLASYVVRYDFLNFR